MWIEARGRVGEALLCLDARTSRVIFTREAQTFRSVKTSRNSMSVRLLVAAAASATAAIACAFVHRRKRQLTLALRHDGKARIITRIILVRHAEREDHKFPQWAAHASRPHDSPLSDAGFEQARRSGKHLRGRNIDFVRSSPLIRTVQTAAAMCEAMGKPSLVVQIDEALCEEEQYLRPRMMGTHKRSVPAADRTAVSPTCDAPRGVCQPVLLRPGDLLSIHRKLDLNYRGSVCMVEHDPRTGVELNAVTKRPQSADERARLIVDGSPRWCRWAPPRFWSRMVHLRGGLVHYCSARTGQTSGRSSGTLKWRSCAALARNVEAGCGTLPARGMLPWAPQRGEAAMPEELSDEEGGSYQTNASEFRVTLYPCMQWSGCGWRHVGEALRCVDTRDSRKTRARSVGSRHCTLNLK